MHSQGIASLKLGVPFWGVLQRIEEPFATQNIFYLLPRAKASFARGVNKKPGYVARLFYSLAEREGFEPPEPRSSTVFKTAAIDHSAISPLDWAAKIFNFFVQAKIFIVN